MEPTSRKNKNFSVSRIHRAPNSMETQLCKDKLNYLMSPFAFRFGKKRLQSKTL